jgi:hypothetical protein
MSDLQEMVLDRLAENMQQSFDFVILCDVMTRFGWTVLEMDYDPDAGQAWHTVKNWADDNFSGDHKEHNGKWLIENSKDATMFSLKWRVKQ